jgi:hypothetical protein
MSSRSRFKASEPFGTMFSEMRDAFIRSCRLRPRTFMGTRDRQVVAGQCLPGSNGAVLIRPFALRWAVSGAAAGADPARSL